MKLKLPVSLISLVIGLCTRLSAAEGGFLSAGYDTRFGDIYEIGFVGQSIMASAGFGGALLGNTFKGAASQSDSAFNLRYGSSAFPANVDTKTTTKAYQISLAYFPKSNSSGTGGFYAGAGYTGINSTAESKFAVSAAGLPANTAATGEYTVGMFDLFVGIANFQSHGITFDLRGGYGVPSAESFEAKVGSTTFGKIDKPGLIDKAFFKLSIGYSW
jgi:hypothetical protein